MLVICKLFPRKEALEKLVEHGKQTETCEKVVKSILEFEDHQGFTCLINLFQMANEYGNETNEYPSGPMLREIEESCFHLIDLAKSFNLDLKKILNHTTKSGTTLFDQASSYSEKATRRLLEENVQVNSVDHKFVTPFFNVSFFKTEIFRTNSKFRTVIFVESPISAKYHFWKSEILFHSNFSFSSKSNK